MPRRDIVKFHGKADATGTSQVLIADNRSRLRLTITNQDGTNSVWAKCVGTVAGTPVAVADATCFKITPTTPLVLTDYTGPVALIASPAPTSVNVLEV
jgi:hypothetical protein